MDKTTRKQIVAQKLAQQLHEMRVNREHMQNQTFEYVLIPASDEEMRISNELYNLRLNMGENLQTECTF